MKGTMNWQVNCGLIQINTTLDLGKLHSMKEDATGEGGKEQEVENAENAKEFIGLMSAMIAEGELSCSKENGIYVYELTLDENAMKQLAETIVPEMVSYFVQFEKGNLKLEVSDEILSEIEIGIDGGITTFFTKVPVGLKVIFDFE